MTTEAPKKRRTRTKRGKSKQPGYMPQMEHVALHEAQEGMCFYCSRKITSERWTHENPLGFTRDHFFPHSFGHPLEYNCVLACADCNSHKGNDMPTPKEIERFLVIWKKFRFICPVDLTEFHQTQSLLSKLAHWFGPFVAPIIPVMDGYHNTKKM